MSYIPPGITVNKVKAIPPRVKVASGRNPKFAWLHELAMEIEPGKGGLQITLDSRKVAEYAKQSLMKFVRAIGPEMQPARKWQAWIVPAQDVDTPAFDLWVECVLLEPAAPDGLNGHHDDGKGEGDGEPQTFVTYTSVGGHVYSPVAMKELLRNRRVVAGEQFTHSVKGVMKVVDRADRLVLQVVKD